MRKRLIGAAVASVVALAAVAILPASAKHSWDGFHWSRAVNPAQLQLVDSLTGEWDSYLGPVVSDWDRSSVLALATEAGGDSLVDRTACLPMQGKIHVCNAMYPDPTWLGLATVYLQGGHVAMATAQVNDTWFNTDLYNDPNAKRHVLCQEIGHTFGLDHQYDEPSCMDDINGLFDASYVGAGAHDLQQLDSIYAHLDGTPTGGGGKGNGKGGGGSKNNRQSDCTKGTCGSEVRVWEQGEYTVVQFVLLAPPTS